MESKSVRIFDAEVVVTEAGKDKVVVRPRGFGDIQAVYLPSFFGGMLGVRMNYTPPAGSIVTCIYRPGDLQAYIIGFNSNATVNELSHASDILQGVYQHDFPHNDILPDKSPTGAPLDLLEGELCLDNDMGVMLSLLTNLIQIKAGDRAVLEASCLNDMVRIISKNFYHHSGIGDHIIRNRNGRLWMEFHATSEDKRAAGLVDDQTLWDKNGSGQFLKDDLEKDNNEDFIDGRWELSQYIGWIGDFINLFFHDPAVGLRKLVGAPTPDEIPAGKSRVAVTHDGSIIMQSVSDIILERVAKVIVPIKIRGDWDAEGDVPVDLDDIKDLDEVSEKVIKTLKASTLEPPVHNDWKPTSAATMHEAIYQLRHYARWLNQMYSLRVFRTQKKTYKVPTEEETPLPEIEGYVERYSTIRIFKDGSILLHDAYNNSIITSVSGVSVASPKNIYLKANKNIYISAGGKISMFGKCGVFISSINDIKIKAGEAFATFLKTGGLILKKFKGGVFKFAVDGDEDITGTIKSEGSGYFKTLVEAGGHKWPAQTKPDTGDGADGKPIYEKTLLDHQPAELPQVPGPLPEDPLAFYQPPEYPEGDAVSGDEWIEGVKNQMVWTPAGDIKKMGESEGENESINGVADEMGSTPYTT